jgi:cell division GTPase FtsZ
MTVSEVEAAVRLVNKRVNQNAGILLSASVDDPMKGAINVLVFLTGVKSPYMFDSTGSVSEAMKTTGLKRLDWRVNIGLKNYYKFLALI